MVRLAFFQTYLEKIEIQTISSHNSSVSLETASRVTYTLNRT